MGKGIKKQTNKKPSKSDRNVRDKAEKWKPIQLNSLIVYILALFACLV